jgi:hypothetical protein
MKRISSTKTAFYKKVFPVIWFGFIGVVAVQMVLQGVRSMGDAVAVVGPILMGVIGYFIMRRFIWDLADEVYDDGDVLVVRNGGKEHRVPLTDIMNVSSTMALNPPRITLRLTGPSSQGPLGDEVSFSPEKRFAWNPFAKNEVAEDLIVRVDRARLQRAP